MAFPDAVPPPTLVGEPLVKLDLGCGNTPKDGFEGVDMHGEKAKHKVDLFKFPWPWADNSVEEIRASHFVEHIPAREVESRDMKALDPALNIDPRGDIALHLLGLDMFFAFFEECHRILKPGGWMEVIVPCLRNNRAFQDPTHRRFICEETFCYLMAEWRAVNIPQYPVKCDFDMTSPGCGTQTTIINEVGLRAGEVQAQMIRHQWNTAVDLHTKMKAIKGDYKHSNLPPQK